MSTTPFLMTVFTPGGTQRQSAHHGGIIDPQIGISANRINRDPVLEVGEGEEIDEDVVVGPPIVGVDEDNIAHFVKVNSDGKLIITTENGDVLDVQDLSNGIIQEEVLKQLIITNIHLQSMSDEHIKDVDIHGEHI